MAAGETAAIAAASAKAGVGVGLFATAVVFTDPAYAWMAVAGAAVGIGSAFHTIFSVKDESFTRMQVTAVMMKSFILGLVSMPMVFLALTEGVLVKLFGIELGEVSISLSIVTSFAASWYFVPVLDAIVEKFKREDR
jgi:hypothetical protein